ncbi:NAD(P)H dehydrogenase B1 mitochondrial-like, partial [Trifolium medium]|nr:NAD(P)H dehydrogenase B1 mitochondrial-like [Trifolium medium]
YKHFGQFAPLGGEQAAAELPGDWVSIGHSTQWLWYGIFTVIALFYMQQASELAHTLFGRV